MYKILIVDDEEIIRRGLRSTIDWTSMGFTVLETAENGAQALKAIERNRPDVMLADIKMPVMDGLALLKIVRREYPDIKVVLLSRHEDFDFARTGMRLGAEGYILKFSIEEDIREIFPRLFSELQEEQSRREKLAKLLAERGNLLYRNFFRRVVEGEIRDTAVGKLMERENEIDLKEGLFCITCIHTASEGSLEELSIQRQKAGMEWLLETAEASGHAQSTNVLFPHGHELVAVHYSNHPGKNQFYQRVLSWSRHLRERVIQNETQKEELDISIGIGSVGVGWQSIYASYVQARKVSFFKTLDLPIPIQRWEAIKDKREKIQILSSIEQRELISSALWGDKERLEQRLSYFFASLKSAAPSAQTEEIQSLILEMFGVLFNRLREINMEPQNVFVEESELFRVI